MLQDMLAQLNRVELIGTVGSARHIRLEDTALVRFSLATTCAFRDREGNAVHETTWHSVTCFERACPEEITRIEKGAKVHVLGRIRICKYTSPEGENRTATEVVAGSVKVLDCDRLDPQE